MNPADEQTTRPNSSNSLPRSSDIIKRRSSDEEQIRKEIDDGTV